MTDKPIDPMYPAAHSRAVKPMRADPEFIRHHLRRFVLEPSGARPSAEDLDALIAFEIAEALREREE